ncbi:hypothetical protein ACFO0N_04475 [Halobium salinum]|uniref:Uncharacterized protein n=1 Tax=Halobium salinum TaxID=1364940 RepID=A0ABD5P943_9EURY|nr:hypothetical protein [Halobium salinum]
MSAPRDPAPRTDDEQERPDPEEFPSASLEFAFNPRAGDFPAPVEFAPDELVVYESQAAATGGAWLSAERGTYAGLDEMR